MKTTVSGTDDSVQRHVSQTATSSEAKLDIGTVTTPGQRIIYTTAQLHKKRTVLRHVLIRTRLIFDRLTFYLIFGPVTETSPCG